MPEGHGCLLPGWEYSMGSLPLTWAAAEKMYHTQRRRRWLRRRQRELSPRRQAWEIASFLQLVTGWMGGGDPTPLPPASLVVDGSRRLDAWNGWGLHLGVPI